MIELQVYALLTRGMTVMAPWPIRALARATIAATVLVAAGRALVGIRGRGV